MSIDINKKLAAVSYNDQLLELKGNGDITDETFVVTGRNNNGEITSIDYYCPSGAMADKALARSNHQSYVSPWDTLTVVNFKNKITKIGSRAFFRSLVPTVDFSEVEEIEDFAFMYASLEGAVYLPKCTSITAVSRLDAAAGTFAGCSKIVSFNAPVLKRIAREGLNNCDSLKTVYCPQLERMGGVASNSIYAGIGSTALESVELGSVGHPVVEIIKNCIRCASTTVVITVFVNADYVDTAVDNIRSAVPSGTIICKDATTGDTILTSEVS